MAIGGALGAALRQSNPIEITVDDAALRSLRERLRGLAAIERQADAILRDALDDAVTKIRKRPPHPWKTGEMHRSWRVSRASLLRYIVRNEAPYSGWVHRKGEKGSLYQDKYAMPLIRDAIRSAVVRIRGLVAQPTGGALPVTASRRGRFRL